MCRLPLVPVRVSNQFEFAFGCSAGHVLALDLLFAAHRDALRSSFEVLIATWEKSIQQLSEGAEVAVKHGSQDLAHRLRCRVAILEQKVLLFRETFLSDQD